MKKTNFITLLSMIALFAGATFFMFFGQKSASVDADTEKSSNTIQSDTVTQEQQLIEDTAKTENTDDLDAELLKPSADSNKNKTQTAEDSVFSMSDALFIGDSRTVGLCEYSGIKGADYFADIGMSVYNIYKKSVSVQDVGKVTLTELLNNKKYGKIYIMLGINEIGYKFEKTAAKYDELIKNIQEKQPSAIILIQANLHVTKSRSDNNKTMNNKAINELNTKLSELANGENIFYIDVNPVFDDENGNLSADKSEDNAHLYAKYYTQWGEWIVNQTVSLLKEG